MGFAAYHTYTRLYYPDGNPDASPTVGYSWIWHHFEQLIISLLLNIIEVVFFIVGLIKEKRPDWKLSDFIKIEI